MLVHFMDYPCEFHLHIQPIVFCSNSVTLYFASSQTTCLSNSSIITVYQHSGEFTGGGCIAVECSPFLVAEINTHGRFGKVDGRFPHWVTQYEGTRYSLIYVSMFVIKH